MKILSLLFIFIAACSGSNKASLPTNTPLPTLVQAAANKPETPKIRLSGQVTSRTRMLLAFQTSGIINHLIAKPGMFFKKGQTMAKLDDSNISLRAESAKLRYEQALNAEKMAQRDFKIEQELHAQGIDSDVQFENMQLNAQNANLTARMAGVDSKIASKALADASLRAPFDCVVTKQTKSLGDASTGNPNGDAVYEIYETSTPEITLQAPESFLGLIKIGDAINIEIPALKIKLPAKIVRYVPIISDQTRTFLVVAGLNKPDSRVVPGYFAEGILK